MEIFSSLLGNEKIKNTLGKEISDSSFLHAYIIEGPEGSGKHTVAKLSAAAIICKNRNGLPCMKCESCRKILSGLSPDVRVLSALKTDDIRDIKQDTYESSTEYDYKIYILEDAEKMTRNAQNALLISLEEPPKNVVFFLLCTNAGMLLETIRSRAQLLRTEPLDGKTIFGYIKANFHKPKYSDEEIYEIIASSDGSLGKAIEMISSDSSSEILKKRKSAYNLVTSLLSLDSEAQKYVFSFSSQSRDSITDVFSLALTVARDIMVVGKCKDAPLCFFTGSQEALNLAETYSQKKILAVYTGIENAISNMNMNANIQLMLNSLINEVKKKGI